MSKRTNYYLIILIPFLLVSLSSRSQNIEVIKAPQLYKMIDDCDSFLCIYNFWATWCAPCIRELPEFDKLQETDNQVKVRLISLDEAENLNTKVKQFIEKRAIRSEVVLLDETDFNEIIPKIDNSWSGAIPATLIVSANGNKYFFEKEFKEGELEETILILKNNLN